MGTPGRDGGVAILFNTSGRREADSGDLYGQPFPSGQVHEASPPFLSPAVAPDQFVQTLLPLPKNLFQPRRSGFVHGDEDLRGVLPYRHALRPYPCRALGGSTEEGRRGALRSLLTSTPWEGFFRRGRKEPSDVSKPGGAFPFETLSLSPHLSRFLETPGPRLFNGKASLFNVFNHLIPERSSL